MVPQTPYTSWWRSVWRLLVGQTRRANRWDCFRRVTIHESDAFTVPDGTRRLRVVSGSAWVSHLREDIIVHTGQVLHLMPDHEAVVVTAVGHQPLELEIHR